MKELIKNSFLDFLKKHGVFIDSNEDSSNDIRVMLEESLGDINKLANIKECSDWLDVFIEVRDELLENNVINVIKLKDQYIYNLKGGDKEYYKYLSNYHVEEIKLKNFKDQIKKIISNCVFDFGIFVDDEDGLEVFEDLILHYKGISLTDFADCFGLVTEGCLEDIVPGVLSGALLDLLNEKKLKIISVPRVQLYIYYPYSKDSIDIKDFENYPFNR